MKYKDYPESWFNCGAFLFPANYSKRPWADAMGTEKTKQNTKGRVESPEIWGFELFQLGRVLNYTFIHFYTLKHY